MKRYLRIISLLPVLLGLLTTIEGFAQFSGSSPLPYPATDFDCGGNECTKVHTGGYLNDINLSGSQSEVICVKGAITNQHLNVNTNGTGTVTFVFCAPGSYTIPQTILQSLKEKVTLIVNSGVTVQLNGGAIHCQVINRGTLTLSNNTINLNPRASIVNAGEINAKTIVFDDGSNFTNYGYLRASTKFGNVNSGAFVYLANHSLVDADMIGEISCQIRGNGGCLLSRSTVSNLNPTARPLTPQGDAITVCIASNQFPQDWINNKGAATLNSNCNECTPAPLPLTVSIVGELSVCPGKSTTLTANVAETGTYSYLWKKTVGGVVSTVGTNSEITTTPDVDAAYEVIVTNTNNPQQTGNKTVQVTIKPAAECPTDTLPINLVAQYDSICIGESVQLSVTGIPGDSNDYIYIWEGENISGNSSVVTVTPSQTSFYKVTVTDKSNTQLKGTGTIRITIKSADECMPADTLPIILTAQYDSICPGESVQLSVTGIPGDSNNYTYTWEGENVSGNSSVVTVTPSQTSFYKVTVTDKSNTQLKGTGTIRITIKSADECMPADTLPIILTAQYDSICPGESVQLSVTGIPGDSNDYTYSWEGENVSGNSAVVTVTPSQTSFYKVTVTDKSNTQLKGTGTIRITIKSADECMPADTLPIILTAQYNSICPGESVQLSVTGIPGDSNNYTYIWEGENISGNSAVVTVTPSQTSFYKVTVTDKSNTQLKGTGTIRITIKSADECMPADTLPIILTAQYNSICPGESVQLSVTGIPGDSNNYTYIWEGENISGNSALVTVTPSQTSFYKVTVTDKSNTQLKGTATIRIVVKSAHECMPVDTLTVTLTVDGNQLVCPEESTNLIANVSGGSGSYIYSWDKVPGNSAVVTVTPTVTTTYKVTVTDKNNSQLNGSATITVSIKTEGCIDPLECITDPGNINCDNCIPLTANNSNIYHGINVCISSSGTETHSVDMNGGTLIICGSGTVTLNGSYNSGSIIINAGATVNIQGNQIQFNNISVINRGSLNFSSSVAINSGSVLNTGSLNISGNLTINGGSFKNKGTAVISQSLTLNNEQVEFILDKNSTMDVNNIAAIRSWILGCGGCLRTTNGIASADIIGYSHKGNVITPATGQYNNVFICSKNGFNASQLSYLSATGGNGTSGGATLQTGDCDDCKAKDAIQIIIVGDSVVCKGGSATLSARVEGGSGSYDFEWRSDAQILSNTAELSTGALQSNTAFTVYVRKGSKLLGQVEAEVTVTECPIDSTDIEINNNGKIITAKEDTICVGESVRLTARVINDSGVFTYKWEGNGKTVLGNPIIDAPNSNMTYTVSVWRNDSLLGKTEVNITVTECPIDSTDIEINNNGKIITAKEDTICVGESVRLTARVINDSGVFTYKWEGNGKTVLGNPIIDAPNSNMTYTVSVWRNDSLLGKTEVNITVIECPIDSTDIEINNNGKIITAKEDTICVGESVRLTARVINDSGVFTYKWEGNGKTVLGNPIIDAPNSNMTYTVSVWRNDSLLGKTEVNITVTECPIDSTDIEINNNGKIITAKEDTICVGESVRLTARVINDSGVFTYKWEGNGKTVLGNPIIDAPNSNMTYTVSVWRNDSLLGKTEVNITVIECPIDSTDIEINNNGKIITAKEDTICVGESVRLTARVINDSGVFTYKWEGNGKTVLGNPIIDAPNSNMTYTVSVWRNDSLLGKTEVNITVIECPIDSTDIEINNNGKIITAKEDTICVGESVRLTARVINDSGVFTYKWEGNGKTVLGNPIIDAPNSNMTYTVSVWRNDSLLGKTEVNITVIECPDPPLPTPCGGQPDLADTAYDCSGCQAPTLNWNGTQIELNSAGRYCLTASSATTTFARVNINQGATLVICGEGTFNLGEININHGNLIIGQHATVTGTSRGVNLPDCNLYNRGNLNISGMDGNPFSLNGGSVVNVGYMNVNGDLNPSNNNGGSFTNYGKIEISGTFGPFNGGNVYLELGSVINTKNIGDVNVSDNILCNGCIHYSGSIGNINASSFTNGNVFICRQTGAGNTSNWGSAEVESDCDHCRLVVIPPKNVSVCDTTFAKGSGSIELEVKVSGGSGGPYNYTWSSASGSGSGTLSQGGPLHPLNIAFSPLVTFPLVSNHVEEVTITVTDPADGKSETVKVNYTILACNPPVIPEPVICEGKVFINKISPTCENNGQLSIGQVNVIGEETIPCEITWTENSTGKSVSGAVFTGVSPGTYHVEISCGEVSCSQDIMVTEVSDGNGNNGLLGKYYTETTEECKFLEKNLVLQRTDANINFDWSQEDLALTNLNIYSIRWSGTVTPPHSGVYRFKTTSNANVTLYVNGQIVMENGIELEAKKEYSIIYDLTGYSPTVTTAKLEWIMPGSSEQKLIRPCFLAPKDLGNGKVNGGGDECGCEEPKLRLLPPVVDICQEGEQTVKLEAIGDGTFLWSPGNETTSSITAGPGFYSVKVTNWCGKSKEQEVQVRSLKDLNINASVTGNKDRICEGQTVGLSATGGKSYKWYPADFLSNPNSANTSATPLNSTTYEVEITTEGGCKVKRSVTVEVEPMFKLEVEVIPDATGCDGDTVTIEVSGADNYRWDPENELISCSRCSSAKHVINGNKTITVSGEKGICSAETGITINSKLPSASSFGFDVQKNPADGCLRTFSVKDYEGFDRFEWNFGDGETGTGTNVSHLYKIHGSYNVCVKAYSTECGQSKEVCDRITIYPGECDCTPQCHD